MPRRKTIKAEMEPGEVTNVVGVPTPTPAGLTTEVTLPWWMKQGEEWHRVARSGEAGRYALCNERLNDDLPIWDEDGVPPGACAECLELSRDGG